MYYACIGLRWLEMLIHTKHMNSFSNSFHFHLSLYSHIYKCFPFFHQYSEANSRGWMTSIHLTHHQVCISDWISAVIEPKKDVSRMLNVFLFCHISDDEPSSGSDHDQVALPVTGVKLCWVCGCPGSKACSRCHNVTYCSKHHQTLHWKHSHKKACGSPGMYLCMVSSSVWYCNNGGCARFE